MDACRSCGAPVARYDTACSFCGGANPRPRKMTVELESGLAHGIQAVQEGRYADAVEEMSRVIAADSEAADAYYYLAAAWQNLNRNDKAIQIMRTLERLRPGSAAVHFNLGVLLAYYGSKKEAIARLQRARELVDKDPDPNLTFDQRREMSDRAEQELGRLSSSEPPNTATPGRNE